MEPPCRRSEPATPSRHRPRTRRRPQIHHQIAAKPECSATRSEGEAQYTDIPEFIWVGVKYGLAQGNRLKPAHETRRRIREKYSPQRRRERRGVEVGEASAG